MDDRHFMKEALALAKKGQGFTSPNPMVGAVIVNSGEIIGRGYHRAAGEPHAEVNAIRDGGSRIRGGTLYVTLEPCNHFGRTPPCTEKILSAGIDRVVVAMADPNPDVTGGGIAFLKHHGVDVTVGVCEREAKKLNEIFIKYSLTKRPFVLVKCAATLDGRIATRTGDSKWVSGEASREYVHRLRHAYDAIMVGIHTVTSDDPALTTRLENLEGKNPVRVVLDSRLRISEDARVLNTCTEAQTIIVAAEGLGDAGFEDKAARIQQTGARMLRCPLKQGRIDLDTLMDRLGALGITSLLIEGGGRVIGSAFAAGIVDRINFFYAPKILGGDDGIPICRGTGPDRMSRCLSVKDIDVRRFGDDVMIDGTVDSASGTDGEKTDAE